MEKTQSGDKKPGLNLSEHTQDRLDRLIFKEEDMSVFELSRWLCLVEGIHEIDKFVTETGREFEAKPIPMLAYIDERTPAMIKDVRLVEGV
tara:strand:+ start:1843 stop:2115 length:273 start_codon:yes stop_codon:yes gene_type:complete